MTACYNILDAFYAFFSYDPSAFWRPLFEEESRKPYFKEMFSLVRAAYANVETYPAKEVTLRAFKECPAAPLGVILGQDPYHNGVADGLSFSASGSRKIPPSLRNVYKELARSHRFDVASWSANLEPWAARGLLMLNASLTVGAGEPLSHKHIPWSEFTRAVVVYTAKHSRAFFMLWGAAAQKIGIYVGDPGRIIAAAHPSPLARGGAFAGCDCFVRVDRYLNDLGLPAIDWRLN